MKRILSFFLLATTVLVGLDSCRQKTQTTTETETPLAKAPAFNADSAYGFIAKQVSFGPRVPNTKAHRACGEWLVAKLKSYGFEVTEQPFTATTYDGQKLAARNLIGSYNPSAPKRILLAAHWDTRPFADKDTAKLKDKPLDGANDGGSGVGALLEIARLIHASPDKPKVGVDIVFFDAEDWGEKADVPRKNAIDNYWALGSQYWAKNPHKPGYSAYYGILLDMVGAKGSHFPKEGGSRSYASGIVDNIWNLSHRLGYSQYFVDDNYGEIDDDHTPVNTVLKVPMIDIIDLKLHSDQTFGSYHHTTQDNLKIIDRGVLKAVGQTVTQALYQEE